MRSFPSARDRTQHSRASARSPPNDRIATALDVAQLMREAAALPDCSFRGKGLDRNRQHSAQPPWGCPIDPLSPQAAAACLNAGDAGLNPAIAGNSSPPPAGNVGSGKFAIPCSRIHRTCASAVARCEALKCLPVEVPGGSSFRHVFIAVWNVGACLRSGGSEPPGSGKSGTPCARTHAANLTPELALTPALVAPPGLRPDAHAASPAAQTAARAFAAQSRRTSPSTISRRRDRRPWRRRAGHRCSCGYRRGS